MIIQIVGYVLFLAVWSFVRIRSLLNMRKNKEAVVFGVLIGVSFIVGSLKIAGVDIPSTTIPLNIMFESLGRMLIKH